MSLARRGKHQRRPGRRHEAGDAVPEPLFVFSREAIREVDRLAVSELRIPSILLMEHASLALVRHVDDLAPEGAVLILCGVGNNAGDGLALARHLHLAGRDVRVVLARDDESLSGDAGINLTMARRLGVPLSRAAEGTPDGGVQREAGAMGEIALVVDAILGTGLSGAPRGVFRALIHAANELRARGVRVLSVDIPSGLDADAGTPAGAAEDVVVADRTVTFVGMKRGFLSVDAQRYIGDVVVEPIGTPVDLSDRLGERLCFAEHPGDDVEACGSMTGGAGGRGEEPVGGGGHPGDGMDEDGERGEYPGAGRKRSRARGG